MSKCQTCAHRNECAFKSFFHDPANMSGSIGNPQSLQGVDMGIGLVFIELLDPAHNADMNEIPAGTFMGSGVDMGVELVFIELFRSPPGRPAEFKDNGLSHLDNMVQLGGLGSLDEQTGSPRVGPRAGAHDSGHYGHHEAAHAWPATAGNRLPLEWVSWLWSQ